jgi:hypothetical protein
MKFNTIFAAITVSYVQAQTVIIRRTDGTSNGLYAPVGQCQGIEGAPIYKIEFPQGGGIGIKFYKEFGCKGGETGMLFREQTISPPITHNAYRFFYEHGPPPTSL